MSKEKSPVVNLITNVHQSWYPVHYIWLECSSKLIWVTISHPCPQKLDIYNTSIYTGLSPRDRISDKIVTGGRQSSQHRASPSQGRTQDVTKTPSVSPCRANVVQSAR